MSYQEPETSTGYVEDAAEAADAATGASFVGRILDTFSDDWQDARSAAIEMAEQALDGEEQGTVRRWIEWFARFLA